jgi:uncharacterized membrane protein (UPF0127 family)
MFFKASLFSILLSALLISCSAPTPAVPPDLTTDSHTSSPKNVGQQLPISGRAIVPNGKALQLEVARTEQQQEMGLMYRQSLPDDRGMLFQFPSPQPIRFWMKNTYIPLDMVFMRKGVVQYIAASVAPCTNDPCPSYGPNEPIDQVIELRSGRAAELGVKKGDQIKIQFLSNSSSQR